MNEWKFRQSSKGILASLIYWTTGRRLDLNQFNLGKPVEIEPLLGDPYKRDTEIEISAKDEPGNRFKGSKVVRYKRLVLSDFSPVNDELIYIDVLPTTTHTLLPQLNNYLDLALQPEDVINDDVVGVTDGIVFRISPDSIAWKGQIDVPVTFDKIPLNVAISEPVLVGFETPFHDNDKSDIFKLLDAVLVTHPEGENYLKDLPVGYIFNDFETGHWSFGNYNTGLDWSYVDELATTNIGGAIVRYNGPNTDPRWLVPSVPENYNSVVIELSSHCNNYYGYVVFNYIPRE